MIVVYSVAAATLLVILVNWVVPAVLKVAYRRVFLLRMANSDAVYLTFDDGPHPESTPRILDMLEERGITATFFVVGRSAEKYPDLVRRARREGHRLGSHGYSHTHAWKTAPWSTSVDLSEGRDVLQGILDTTSATDLLFRPPFGKLNLGSLRFLSRETAWWSVDPRDYECRSGGEVLTRLEDQLEPGAVILLHDGRLGGRAPGQGTVDAVRLILEYGEQNGLTFEALPGPC